MTNQKLKKITYNWKNYCLGFMICGGTFFALTMCTGDPDAPNPPYSNPMDTETTSINMSVFNGSVSEDYVTLYMFVTNQVGTPIKNLRNENFFINTAGAGVSMGGSSFTVHEDNTDVVVSAAMVMDYSKSMGNDHTEAIETSGIAFVNLMDENDLTEIIKFSDKVQVIQKFTSNKQALIAAIKGSFQGNGDTVLNDAMYKAVLDTSSQPGRKGVIVLTDGGENASAHGENDIVNLALANNIPLFLVGLYGKDYNPDYMREIARLTHGQYFDIPSDKDPGSYMLAIYTNISQIFTNVYEIRFKSTNVDSGTRIVIRVYYNGYMASDTYIML